MSWLHRSGHCRFSACRAQLGAPIFVLWRWCPGCGVMECGDLPPLSIAGASSRIPNLVTARRMLVSAANRINRANFDEVRASRPMRFLRHRHPAGCAQCADSLLECLLRCCDGQGQSIRRIWQRHKTEMPVEAGGLIILGIHQYQSNADIVGYLDDSLERINQQ